MKVIKDLGNLAVHSHKPVRQFDALTATKELFHFMFWLARTYARGAKPADGLSFNPDLLPKSSAVPPQTLEQLQKLESQLRERDEKLSELLSGKKALDDELERLRIEVAEAKKQNAARPDDHDYSEAETRDYFIDLLLKEAGWALDKPQDREFPVTGMPNNKGEGFVDYVLWGDDGKPLGLVEAKRTKRDARVGQQQAKLYADCLEKQFGQRPVIFYSNGYDHWMWDDAELSAAPGAGLLQESRSWNCSSSGATTRKTLADAKINESIVERYYQSRAIRRVGEAFERDQDRKALLVMATGAGKTRTVIALCDLLMRCNWAKRVLFLADRVALVKQAVNAFKKFLARRLAGESGDREGRRGPGFCLDLSDDDGADRRDATTASAASASATSTWSSSTRRTARSTRSTAPSSTTSTRCWSGSPPRRRTKSTATPTACSTSKTACRPTTTRSTRRSGTASSCRRKLCRCRSRFQREGIHYDELSEEEKEEWDALEWDDDGTYPTRVEAEAVNNWLFNKDTVDKVLEHLMTRGLKVAGGDRLGKTIVFAKNQDHAQFIAERFNANYPHYKGEFARVIDFRDGVRAEPDRQFLQL